MAAMAGSNYYYFKWREQQKAEQETKKTLAQDKLVLSPQKQVARQEHATFFSPPTCVQPRIPNSIFEKPLI